MHLCQELFLFLFLIELTHVSRILSRVSMIVFIGFAYRCKPKCTTTSSTSSDCVSPIKNATTTAYESRTPKTCSCSSSIENTRVRVMSTRINPLLVVRILELISSSYCFNQLIDKKINLLILRIIRVRCSCHAIWIQSRKRLIILIIFILIKLTSVKVTRKASLLLCATHA